MNNIDKYIYEFDLHSHFFIYIKQFHFYYLDGGLIDRIFLANEIINDT